MKFWLAVVISSVAAAVICISVLTNEYTNELPVEAFGQPNLVGALGDNISPGSFPEYRLPGKMPGTMPPAAKMISRHRLVGMIQGIETDRIKMNNLREKVQLLKAQDMAVRLQAKTLMLNLKSNIVGVTDQNKQVGGVSSAPNMHPGCLTSCANAPRVPRLTAPRAGAPRRSRSASPRSATCAAHRVLEEPPRPAPPRHARPPPRAGAPGPDGKSEMPGPPGKTGPPGPRGVSQPPGRAGTGAGGGGRGGRGR
jgi:hypothetical protein